MTTKRGRWCRGLAALLFVIVGGCQADQPTVTKPKSIRPDPDVAQVPSKQLRPYYNQNPTWEDCGEQSPAMECAKVLVPLDYDRPSGERIEIAVNKLPATGPKPDRIGSLVLQPGGPGTSGLEFTGEAAESFDGRIRERFDLVSFDRRGVGQSSPVRCLPEEDKDEFVTSAGSAEASDDLEEASRLQKRFTDGCKERSGDLLAHLGTENVVRDLDVLRSVLGDRDLNYLGYAYGGTLGARYAEMFPAKYRALVLDGAIDPNADLLDQRVAEAKGTRRALRSFVRDCAEQEDCPLPSDKPKAVTEEIAELVDQAAEQPLSNAEDPDRPVGATWVTAGIRSGLYAETSWPDLREALDDAIERGDGTGLMRLAEPYLGRSPDGSWDNSLEANLAISCADQPPVDRDRAESTADSHEQVQESGLSAHTIDWAWLQCYDWPVDVQEPEPFESDAVEPALVVGTRHDPAIPYAWPSAVAKELPGARLLTYEGDGHGAYRRAGSRCVNDAVDGYLIRGEMPGAGASCRAVEDEDD